MTIQDMKTCLFKVYESRKADLALSHEQREQLLEKKYPLIPPPGSRGLDARMRAVLDTFESCSPGEDHLDPMQIYRLSNQLYLEHGLLQENTLEMRNITEVLRSHMNAGRRYSGGVVEKLFDYAFDLYLHAPEFYSGPNGTESLDRQIKAARRVRKYISKDWTVQVGRIHMDKAIMEELQRELESKISRASGYAVLQHLLRTELQPHYDKQLDHFFILRPKRGGKNFMALPQAAVPINYLIQLALKYIEPPVGKYLPPTANIHVLRDIIEIARDMMTVLNLSDAECMSDFLVLPRQMPDYISDNAQYDSMCIPFQYTPDFCEWLVEKFYLPFAQKARLVGVKRAYLPVLRWCLKQPPLSFFNAEKIQRETGLGLKQIKLVLDICAQAAEDVNRGFHSLADDVTTRNFPLICLRNGMYFQLDPHLSGYAFCECIYQELKKRIRDFDRNLGVSLEALIKGKLRERKISFSCGHYTDMQGRDRDCDLILEGADRILFMEVKKRPLPGKFQQGDSLEIFSALADGMVYGQVQALRHKIVLEQNHTLTLYADPRHEKPCASISLNGRRIYTVSVCLPEYAFFTTAVIAQKVLYLLNGRISATDPAQSDKLNKFNKLADEFREIAPGSDNAKLRAFLHNSAFRSLHQVWTALNLCPDGDVDQLIRLLVCDCTMATYNLDFYHSLYGALRYNKS